MRRGDDGGDDHEHHDAAPQRVLGGGQEDATLLQSGLQLLQLEGGGWRLLQKRWRQEQGAITWQALREEEDKKGREEEDVAAKNS